MPMNRKQPCRSRNTVGIVGVPVCHGQARDGTELAPRALREGGLAGRLEGMGYRVNDHGDVMMDLLEEDSDGENHSVNNPRTVAAGTIKVADAVETALLKDGFCLALGGDHSMAMGTILAHTRVQPDVCVLWIDAHADINTPLTSESGNLHGMPLAFMLHELKPYVPALPGFEDIKPCISSNRIAWIGLRAVDKGEKKIIDKFGMTAFCMQDVDRYGIREVVERALRAIDPSGTRSIHLSFDVDAMDPSLMPSTGTREQGGLSRREILYIAEEVASTGRLTMLDVAEINPLIGGEKAASQTVQFTLEIIEHLCGNRRQGVYPADYDIPQVADLTKSR